MKKILLSMLTACCALALTTATAQENKKTTAGQDIKSAGKKVGRKTANVASNVASKVADQQIKGKTGPDGQAVYVNGKQQYYYIGAGGKHQYITKAQLKDKY